MKKAFNNQFATQRLLQEQKGPFYVVYNKGRGRGKGVHSKHENEEDAKKEAEKMQGFEIGTPAPMNKAYYVVGPNHDDYNFASDEYRWGKKELDEEGSVTGGGEAYLPGLDVPEKKYKNEAEDKEPKLAAGKAKVYMKNKWGWKLSPSEPNRESDAIDYKQLYENLNAPDSSDDYIGKKIKHGNQEWEVIRKLVTGEYLLSPVEGGYPDIKVIPDTIKRALKENYSRFKKETKTRTNEQQLHAAMKLAEKKIHEANRILEYTAQLREELTETRVNKITEKLMEKVTRGIAEAYGKMKKLK